MSELLHIAVVGHTNVGKTSLLRTLTRRVDFGEVSDRPGTTRHVEAIDLRAEDAQGRAQTVIRFYDTPGLEDAVTLLDHVKHLPGDTRPARIHAFLQGPEAHGLFEQEAKVLNQLLKADAAFLVIDSRQPVLPKYRDEVELLTSCARPVMPVLNFVRHADSREAAWRTLLAESGLHTLVRFDAAAPFTGSEQDLFVDLGTLLPTHRHAMRAVAEHLAREAQARRQAACHLLATALVEGAALCLPVPEAHMQNIAKRNVHLQSLRTQMHTHAQATTRALLSLHGFRPNDAAEPVLHPLQGLKELDLFDPETLRQSGVRLGQGAAVGAAVGLAADVALAGLSLGTGTALGGLIGGALAQGWGPLGQRVRKRLQGTHELRVEDPVLYLMADSQLRLLLALEQRGHGANAPTQSIQPSGSQALPEPATKALIQALKATRPARTEPSWFVAAGQGLPAPSAKRQRCIEAVAAQLAEAAQGAQTAPNTSRSAPSSL